MKRSGARPPNLPIARVTVRAPRWARLDLERHPLAHHVPLPFVLPHPSGWSLRARAVGCPSEGIRALAKAARIVVLEPELAYAMSTYKELAARALSMAATAPLTPAAFRDATGTSRKYVMAILEDLDRRAILRRTPDGHVPGPRAPTPVAR